MRRLLLSVPALVVAGLLAIPLVFAPGDQPVADAARLEVPARALAAYQQAAVRCPGLRWELLAAIGFVESGHGTAGGSTLGPDGHVTPPVLGPPLDGTGTGGNTTPLPAGPWAGTWGLTGPWMQAVGPMQFLPPTFAAWAVDGDNDGTADPHDLDDAAATTAHYLCGPEGRLVDERAALRRYNPDAAYIETVLQWATRYRSASPLAAPADASAAALLGNPNITIYPGGRDDLASGRVDPRVITVLSAVAQDHTLAVSSLVTGHPRCAVNGQVPGPDCTVSNHCLGRAADIAVLDGAPVSARHPGAVALMTQLAALPAPVRPDEIGGPVDTGQPGVFTDTLHADHIHIGWG